MSLKHIPAKNLKMSTPTWWLESRFHFSPTLDLELTLIQTWITYVVDGKLTHKDSMGTAETLGRGSVQYMSAGRGITHTEMDDNDEMLRFLQLWIKPNAKGLAPNYGSRTWKFWTIVASSSSSHSGTLKSSQEITNAMLITKDTWQHTVSYDLWNEMLKCPRPSSLRSRH